MTLYVEWEVQGWFGRNGWEAVDTADTEADAYASRDVYRVEDRDHAYRVRRVIDHQPQHG